MFSIQLSSASRKERKESSMVDMNKSDVIDYILRNKIVAILRKISPEHYLQTVEAFSKGGIRLMEVTFDQTGVFSKETTIEQIRSISEKYQGQVLAGAGTVLNVEQVDAAYHAGAKYIISPNTDEKVIKRTVELGMVSIPGALTPTEVENANKWGADFVKLFPSGDFGISYIKSIMAPLNHVKYIAVGSVSANNLMDFINLGVAGVGVSSSLVNMKLIKEEKYAELTALALKFTSQI